MPLMVNGIQVDINAINNASPVIKQVAADAGALETQNGSLGASEVAATESMGGMVATAAQLGQVIGLATTAVAAFGSAFEFGEIAAGNERLRQSGEQLAAQYGQSMDVIVSKVHNASLGTVSDMDIIASSNKAMMLGVGGDADKLANLMEIAAFRGRAMGLSTAQAFDDMSRGIGRMSPMILDNLGIVVDADSTYSAYAESIGKSANELSRSEKVQALLNKVLEEGNSQLEAAGGLAEDNATSYERWNAELENTKNFLMDDFIGMSRVADMGADLLTNFRNLADNGIGYGNDKLNAFSLFMDFGASRVQKMKEEQYAAADAITAHGEALDAIPPKIQAVAAAQVAAEEVNAEAVKGAMKVHDTYVEMDGKLKDLQVDHDDLLAKKEQLISQGWWPESEKIKDVNDKLAENEQKQKDVTTAMQGTLAQMILNTAAAGLDAEGQLALARATGQIDEATYAALTAQTNLKKQYEDGAINAQQYAEQTLALKTAVGQLQDKKIAITVDGIFNEMRTIITNYGETRTTVGSGKGYADGGISTGPDSGHLELLHGTEAVIPLKDGSIPVQLQGTGAMSGGGSGGNITLQINYAPTVSFGDESEAQSRMWPFILNALQMARANGQI